VFLARTAGAGQGENDVGRDLFGTGLRRLTSGTSDRNGDRGTSGVGAD
jgi:hypothetical protein